MMFGNSWHKKERPFLGLQGMGGGAAGWLVSGSPKNSGITASGGTESPYTDPNGVSWTSHKFISGGAFVVSDVAGTGALEYLVVGGGGGGSGATPWDSCGGGGGACICC